MSNVVWISSDSDLRRLKARATSLRGGRVMAELDFEMKLDRMFNEPPAMADGEAFARLVEMRLDRGWTLRQVAIGSAGLIAGLVGVSQLLGSRLLFDAGEATQRNSVAFTSNLNGL